MTPAEWLDVCALISDLWPHRPMPPDSAKVWYPLLADLPGDDIAAAVRRIALEPDNAWPPSLGQLRAATQPRPRPWEDAVAELRATIAQVGSYAPAPSFDDPALAATVRAYGWKAVCRCDLADPAVRAQLRDCYRRAQDLAGDSARHQLAARPARHLEVVP